jgi:hypothetical protein
MIWHAESDDEQKAIERLAKDSDRAAAIVAATIVEIGLTKAIQNQFHPDEAIQRNLFRPSGALGSFGTKIDLAFVLGIYSADARRDLVTMKDVRNAFAHHLDIVDFDSQRIRGLCFNLKFCERFIHDMPSQAHVPEEKKLYTILKFNAPAPPRAGDHATIRIGMADLGNRLGSARGRYITSAQIFTMLLGNLPPIPNPSGPLVPQF